MWCGTPLPSVKRMLSAVALLLLVGVLVAPLTQTSSSARANPPCATVETVAWATPVSSTPARTVPVDLQFIDTMTHQLASASRLASLALVESGDAGIRRIALRIAESHAGEIQLLRHWRQSWYPEVPQSPATQPDPDVALSLCVAGPNFDQAFIEAMISQLLAIVRTAEAARDGGARTEIADLADTIIQARNDDIAALSRMRESQS